MNWDTEDQPLPLKILGLPWDHPNADPLGDMRWFAQGSLERQWLSEWDPR